MTELPGPSPQRSRVGPFVAGAAALLVLTPLLLWIRGCAMSPPGARPRASAPAAGAQPQPPALRV